MSEGREGSSGRSGSCSVLRHRSIQRKQRGDAYGISFYLSFSLEVEEEVTDVAVFDNIVFALRPHEALFLGC